MSSVRTPPATTLSTPSPTERASSLFADIGEDPNFTKLEDMSNLLSIRPIYLIVATSMLPPLGIGLKNQLPWGPLKPDMAFFKRVTTNSKPAASTLSTDGASSNFTVRNAVVMGRKTWDSIPPRFRPLAGRLNVVVTRSGPEKLAATMMEEFRSKDASSKSPPQSSEGSASELYTHAIGGRPASSVYISSPNDNHSSPVLITDEVSTALNLLTRPSHLAEVIGGSLSPAAHAEVGNIFIIGGSQIYASALDHLARTRSVNGRILQTQVRRRDGGKIDCDTFFPGDRERGSLGSDWKEIPKETVEGWVDGKLPQGEQEWRVDGEMGIKVVGWEGV